MYFSFWTLCKSISSSLWKEDRTSSTSLARTWGCVARRKVAPDKPVAEVSEPATMRRPAFSSISSLEIFYRLVSSPIARTAC